MAKAVVLGTGFGGLAVLSWLRRLMRPGELTITAVDRLPDMVYRPALVHALDGPPTAVQRPARVAVAPLLRRLAVHGIRDTVVGVDPARRQVHLATAEPLDYDVLFIATGRHYGWDLVPGLAPHLGGVCEDYLARHAAVLNQAWRGGRFVFAVGPIHGAPDWTPPLAVGCECPLLESALLFDRWLRRRGRRDATELTVLTPGPVIAQDAGARARERILELFSERGIAVLTGSSVRRVTGHTLELSNRQAVAYDRSIWIPPYAGSPWLHDSGVDDGFGWVPTDGHLNHPLYPDIYAVGDITSHPWPKMGHAAMVQARIAVHHWVARQRRALPPRSYQPMLVWALELGAGRGLLIITDEYWGGRRHFMAEGRWPAAIKWAFQKGYVWRRGALPIMP